MTIEQHGFTAQEPNLVLGFYLVCGLCLQAWVGRSGRNGCDRPCDFRNSLKLAVG
jgi:hypothetical protein